MRRLQQVAAGVRVREAPDAQAVGRIQLAQEEFAAGIPYPVQLEEAGGRKQRLRGKSRQEGRCSASTWFLAVQFSISENVYSIY